MSVYRLERQGDVDELIRLLRESDSASVRARGAEALGEIDEPGEEAVDALVELAREDDHDAVRGHAIDALDTIGERALGRLIAEIAGERFDGEADGDGWLTADAAADLLVADLPELRMAAAAVLGRIGTPAAVPALLDRIDDADVRVRVRAIRALGAIGDPRATSALSELIDDDDPRVRRAVADALGELSGDTAVSSLVSLVDDPDEQVRRAAVVSLGEFESLRPVDRLVEALSDDAGRVRRAATYSLIELLSNAPPDRSHDVREAVVDSLNATDDPSVIEPLIEILEESQQAHQRRNTAWLLGRIAGERTEDAVVSALVGALGDEDEMVSQFAATGLSTIGGDTVEDALIDVLDHRDSAVRAKAVFTLGSVGGERARERVGQLIDRTDDEDVRKQAFSALSRLGGRTDV